MAAVTSHNLKLPRTGQTATELYALTMKKKEFIESQGFKYVCKWECQFRKDLENISELRAFVDSVDMSPRLDPRDSFFGGRTDTLRLYHQVQSIGESIQYDDICSLYPAVNKYERLPCWAPQNRHI